MSKKVKFGILGCGNIARNAFIPALKLYSDAELVAIASRSTEKAQSWAKEFGCHAVTGYDTLVARGDIEAVYIALPIGLHKEWIIQAARAGKQIFCEKTLTPNLTDTRVALNVCLENNVALFEGYAYQFHPQHQLVRNLVDHGEIGEPILFNAWFGFPPLRSSHRYDPDLGGGALLDAGTYTVHAATHFFKKEPAALQSFLDYGNERVDIHGTVIMNFDRGRTAALAFGFDNMYRNSYSIWGTKGSITLKRAFSIPPDFSATLILEKQDYYEEKRIEPHHQFLSGIKHFCEHMSDSESRNQWRNDILSHAQIMEKIKLSN